jgi:translation initiation factor IF-2
MGRVRALINDQGEAIQEAGPSVPVEVLGFNGTPEAGDRLAVVENEARARQVTDYRAQKREKGGARQRHARLARADDVAAQDCRPQGLPAGHQGRRAGLARSHHRLAGKARHRRGRRAHPSRRRRRHQRIRRHAGGGFNAAIIGFNVRAHKEAGDAAKRDGIEIRYYNIIYDLVDDVKKAMSGLLTPERCARPCSAMRRSSRVFNISKVGKIAGCRVTDGTVERGANVRLIRDNVVIHEGKLSQLKRFKDDAKEVTAGQECGMAFENYQDMRAGDVIECYRVETIQRSL